MKILFIGGTGVISSACADLAVARGHDLFVLNRGASIKHPLPDGVTLLMGDIHADEAHLASLVAGHRFDAVVDYIAFTHERHPARPATLP
jgi:nucleoside-diphosphate-sugar epimerase